MSASRLRVAVVADYAEEGWPSMDLVADMLMARLVAEHAHEVDATLVRPAMPRLLSRTLDRVAGRFVHYPRVLAPLRDAFDVFHLVDHSYAQLLHGLPAARTLVTCHDLDTFRSVLQPQDEPRSLPFRLMTRRILSGLRLAAHVACDSEATRAALVSVAGFPLDRLSVIPNGTDTGGDPDADAAADVEAARMLGPRRAIELLHVGSTIPRKRIDVLLEVFAAVHAIRPDVRLTRVGGPFTAEQRVRARDLGVLDAIHVLPFVDRATLAAVYRRSALALLTSDREGFGLPIVEALACGTPMVASDIPVLREIGSDAVTYCQVGDIEAWAGTVLRLIAERSANPPAWQARRSAGLIRAAGFSWSRYTDAVVARYCVLAGRPAPAGAAR
jgi:glycosyltransferase involved in cell wall biosynthesis